MFLPSGWNNRSSSVSPSSVISVNPSTPPSQVAVIVVGRDDRAWLPVCLTTILDSDRTGQLDVIYVDNSSSDGSQELVATSFPVVRMVAMTENLGYAGACQAGYEFAQEREARYVLFLNSDMWLPKSLIRELTGFLDEHPCYGIVGPLQTEYSSPAAAIAELPLNGWTRTVLAGLEPYLYDQLLDAPMPRKGQPAPAAFEYTYVQGAALFARTEAFEAAGGFDVSYHTFYEEIDLCRRVRWCGYRIALLENLRIAHFSAADTAESPYRTYHSLRNRYICMLTDPMVGRCRRYRLAVGWFFDTASDAIRGGRTDLLHLTPGVAWDAYKWLVRNQRQLKCTRQLYAATDWAART